MGDIILTCVYLTDLNLKRYPFRTNTSLAEYFEDSDSTSNGDGNVSLSKRKPCFKKQTSGPENGLELIYL